MLLMVRFLGLGLNMMVLNSESPNLLHGLQDKAQPPEHGPQLTSCSTSLLTSSSVLVQQTPDPPNFLSPQQSYFLMPVCRDASSAFLVPSPTNIPPSAPSLTPSATLVHPSSQSPNHPAGGSVDPGHETGENQLRESLFRGHTARM